MSHFQKTKIENQCNRLRLVKPPVPTGGFAEDSGVNISQVVQPRCLGGVMVIKSCYDSGFQSIVNVVIITVGIVPAFSVVSGHRSCPPPLAEDIKRVWCAYSRPSCSKMDGMREKSNGMNLTPVPW